MSVRITHDIKYKEDYKAMFIKIKNILGLTENDDTSYIIKSEFDKKEKEIMELYDDAKKIYKREYIRNIENNETCKHNSLIKIILKHAGYNLKSKSYQYKKENKYTTSVKYFIISNE